MVDETSGKPPELLVTKAIALRGAEKSLEDRLEEVKKQKAKVVPKAIAPPPPPENQGYAQTPSSASKKSTKREGEQAAEIMEAMANQTSPTEDVWIIPAVTPVETIP